MKNLPLYAVSHAVLVLALCSALAASSEHIIFPFPADGFSGYYPTGGLISDAAGNLYGVTEVGGAFQNGAVFKLSFESGVWTETVLYSFLGAAGDGAGPASALLLDKGGNLYGTTAGGGASAGSYGTVFKLAPDGNGGWTETILHSFNGNDGGGPMDAPLVSDAQGNLYGVTHGGCVFGYCSNGSAFELSPKATGGWSFKVLHSFGHTGLPDGGLIFDKAGNLYGTTTYSGPKDCSMAGCGTIYKLSRGAKSWVFTTIHAFNYSDGEYPWGNLLMDSSGNIYGATLLGGAYNGGLAYRLSPTKTGWKETVLYVFGAPGDGSDPSSLIFGASSGHLFGTVPISSDANFNQLNGYVFELSRNANGTWNESRVYSFPQGNLEPDPNSYLIWNSTKKTLFGTVGPYSDPSGAVYEVTP